MSATREPRGRRAPASARAEGHGSSRPSRGTSSRGSQGSPGSPGSMTSHDCTVLALVLVERLSLAEAAAALEVPVAQLRRDYESALKRVRRKIAPVMQRADLARALTRPAPAWRRVS